MDGPPHVDRGLHLELPTKGCAHAGGHARRGGRYNVGRLPWPVWSRGPHSTGLETGETGQLLFSRVLTQKKFKQVRRRVSGVLWMGSHLFFASTLLPLHVYDKSILPVSGVLQTLITCLSLALESGGARKEFERLPGSCVLSQVPTEPAWHGLRDPGASWHVAHDSTSATVATLAAYRPQQPRQEEGANVGQELLGIAEMMMRCPSCSMKHRRCTLLRISKSCPGATCHVSIARSGKMVLSSAPLRPLNEE